MTTKEFQDTFLTHSTKPTGAASALDVVRECAETYRRSAKQAGKLGVGDDGMREIRTKVARGFVKRWMGLWFPLIDLSFTKDAKAWVTVHRDGDEAKVAEYGFAKPATRGSAVNEAVVECPRFWRASAEAKPFCMRGGELKLDLPSTPEGFLSHGKRGGVALRHLSFTIQAKIPDGVGESHRTKAGLALALYDIGAAMLLPCGLDVQADIRGTDRWGRSDVDPRITVLWTPTKETLSIGDPPRPQGDPAVIFSAGGTSVLLDFFDTPDEQCIEHLIREFTTGTLR